VQRLVAAVAAIGITTLAALTAVAPPALADVLVNQPASSVCVGKTITVGVWYQQFSGGSRAYRADVYGPTGRRIFARSGQAPSSGWKFWRVRLGFAGKYRTDYHYRDHGTWRKYGVTTRARRC
jgi:hypothetical protein